MLTERQTHSKPSLTLHLGHRLCEACGRKRARRHSPFCSQECAETFMYYD
ncbi:hypothetical protein [Rathayibacter sp. VKM Ac-2754]|nr:hypothetical protein [Rathayibacter sp. VKM Ac-2754]MWV59433.1 hypothetical protein [Rathayibacter sp. VKM Ac-2754]